MKVAVIGAGLAGLTAALRLHQKGIDVEIYEARSRVGGRVFTAWIKNKENTYSLIELGGQNISDGGEALHFLSLAKELGLESESKETNLSFLIYHQGQYKDFRELLKASTVSNQDIDEASKDCTSMVQLLDKLFVEDDFLKLAIQTRLVAYEGVDLEEQSIYHNIDTLKAILKGGIAPAHPLERITFKQIKGGNAKLPLKIAEKLAGKLHLNKILKEVLEDHDQIKLIFSDNTYAHCDKLILTIPASVYSDIQFDDAVIPLEKIQQISSIAYGASYKICIPVEKRMDASYRGVITHHFISFYNQDEKIMIKYCIDDMPRAEQTLTTLQDKQFDYYDFPITHIWKEDKYAKGSYAGYSVKLNHVFDKVIDYQGIPVKQLFAPQDDRIFFIGEHTTLLDMIGTMEAAVESAERIVKLI